VPNLTRTTSFVIAVAQSDSASARSHRELEPNRCANNCPPSSGTAATRSPQLLWELRQELRQLDARLQETSKDTGSSKRPRIWLQPTPRGFRTEVETCANRIVECPRESLKLRARVFFASRFQWQSLDHCDLHILCSLGCFFRTHLRPSCSSCCCDPGPTFWRNVPLGSTLTYCAGAALLFCPSCFLCSGDFRTRRCRQLASRPTGVAEGFSEHCQCCI
jgi:hypothetical protein